MTDRIETRKGPLSWMATNPVAANILMILFLVGGIGTAYTIKQEVFPDFTIESITVSIAYPGSSPEEVEEGIITPVEEAIRDIDGIKEIESNAAEGAGTVSIEFESGINTAKALSDVKSAVEGLKTLPEDSEDPKISLTTHKMLLMTFMLYGDIDEFGMKSISERLQEDMLALPEVSSVTVSGIRPREIAVEIPQEKLQEYGLTLNGIASMVRSFCKDISAGSVDTASGEKFLRIHERKDTGSEFLNVPVAVSTDGTAVRLRDIAKVTDGFEDSILESSYNGKPAVGVNVYSDENTTPVEAAEKVDEFLTQFRTVLPEGMHIVTFLNFAEIYKERLNLLMSNAYLGLILVVILLGIFLEIKVAFWVTMGLPVSFLGALFVLPAFGITINMVSLMGFIMALGMLVDDAIVIGENIYSFRQKGYSLITAAIEGTRQVAVPVTFAIITNIVAFFPLIFIGGIMGKIIRSVPIVVISAFTVSLIEALIILPAHLGHSKPLNKGIFGLISRGQQKFANAIEALLEKIYRPIIDFSTANRYFIIAACMTLLVAVAAYVGSGRIKMMFSEGAEEDEVNVAIELKYGAPVSETRQVVSRIIDAAWHAVDRIGQRDDIEGVYCLVGMSEMMHFTEGAASHEANVRIYLVGSKERDFEPSELVEAWRRETGTITGVEKLVFSVKELGPPGGEAIHVRLNHRDSDILEEAARELAESLEIYPQVKDIDDGLTLGKPQLDFTLKPEALSNGLTAADVGNQVRAAFYGTEVTRFQRGRDEVRVMVRIPERDRTMELSVENMLINTPGGTYVPLREIADVKYGYAYTVINRIDTRRVVSVCADVYPTSEAAQVLSEIKKGPLVDLMSKFPGLTYSIGGREQERAESMGSLYSGFLFAFVAIFGMLAIVFRSYVQPLIVMTAIPFGVIGAVIGHVLLGYNLSLMSMMGIVALAGVVVNDSLVLIDLTNSRRREGRGILDAVKDAGLQRLRPILLTTLTTFGGLAPMMLETSPEVKMLIPMAISLGFGVLFSTAITLLLVPSLYTVIEKDFKGNTAQEKSAPDSTLTPKTEEV